MQPKESNSNKHFKYSIIKSGIRIAAYTMIAFNHLWMAGVVLIAAEMFGIAEEL